MAKTNARQPGRYWSAAVTHDSNALDLKAGVFCLDNPRQIAWSLKRSADRSCRRKGTSFQSAMSMLNFYLNRGGTAISPRQKEILTHAKEELRLVYQRTDGSHRTKK